MSVRGFRVSWVRLVSLCVGLTEVNSSSWLAMILLFIALKTLYLNVAPYFMGVPSLLIESLVVTHMACETITNLLSVSPA